MARAKIFKEIIKTKLIIHIYVQENQTRKITYPWFFSLIHNEITWFSLIYSKKGKISWFSWILKWILKFPECWLTYIVHLIDKKGSSKMESLFFFKNIKKMRKVGRIHFQKVRPKGNKCAMPGSLFSEKCARDNFSAPFA